MKPEANPKMMVLSSPVGLRSIINSLVAFSIIVSSVTLLFYRCQEEQVPMAIEHEHQKMQVQMAAEHHEQLRAKEAPVPMTAELPDARKEECNWSTGRWVYDNLSRPLYSGLKCSFIFPELSCDKYGRKDVMYQHWRWQPYGCDLPRYDYNRFSQFGSISSSVLFMSLSSQQLKRKIWR